MALINSSNSKFYIRAVSRLFKGSRGADDPSRSFIIDVVDDTLFLIDDVWNKEHVPMTRLYWGNIKFPLFSLEKNVILHGDDHTSGVHWIISEGFFGPYDEKSGKPFSLKSMKSVLFMVIHDELCATDILGGYLSKVELSNVVFCLTDSDNPLARIPYPVKNPKLEQSGVAECLEQSGVAECLEQPAPTQSSSSEVLTSVESETPTQSVSSPTQSSSSEVNTLVKSDISTQPISNPTQDCWKIAKDLMTSYVIVGINIYDARYQIVFDHPLLPSTGKSDNPKIDKIIELITSDTRETNLVQFHEKYIDIYFKNEANPDKSIQDCWKIIRKSITSYTVIGINTSPTQYHIVFDYPYISNTEKKNSPIIDKTIELIKSSTRQISHMQVHMKFVNIFYK